ncbi:hypothetical protein HYH02_006355 [Chlamydomonas schloesseri]|uniref:VTT domain-containing protein n=1 Tax=Chlamydomonas schloesseri TaxID=2026947 RepID=A0A836B611_9CHLO|nr:hypothetical protein HYH02_006355 [Chlamydomonas schloesseri]|eukprot:KAG2448463.1 hypothetical protein HYH02_006355 [Chlamydomonas schloesseri]
MLSNCLPNRLARFRGPAPSRQFIQRPLIAPAAGQRPAGLQVVSRAGPSEQSQPNHSQPTPTLLSASGSETDEEQDPLASILDAEVSQHGAEGEGNKALGPLAGLGSIGGIVLLLGVGALLKDNIRDFLEFFIDAVESWGPLGYLAYAGVYTGLEVLAVPAIPLTMTAGVIFGPIPGTIITSLSGTLAATIAFLIARYAARDKILRLARRNTRFNAIDKAIARNGFKFVTLLRLSPLLPLAASNYLYGLTSVDLGSYVAGSFLGMLPGTYAYVTTGHLGKAALMEGEGSLGVESWQVALGLGVTLLAIGYVGQLAKGALEEAEKESDVEEEEGEQGGAKAAAGASGSSGNGNGSGASSSHANGNGDGAASGKGKDKSVPR